MDAENCYGCATQRHSCEHDEPSLADDLEQIAQQLRDVFEKAKRAEPAAGGEIRLSLITAIGRLDAAARAAKTVEWSIT